MAIQEKADFKAQIKAQVSEWQAKQADSPTKTALTPPALPIEKAQRAAAAAAAAKAAEADEAMKRGHEANERGEYEAACQHFKHAHTLSPRRVSARVSAANMSLKLGEAKLAVGTRVTRSHDSPPPLRPSRIRHGRP